MAVQSESARRQPATGAPAGPVIVMRRPPLWRRLLAWLLLLLFCVTAPFALLAGWGRWAVSDADRVVATLGSAADDPRLQAALARAVRDRLDDGIAGVAAPAARQPDAVPLLQANPPTPTATAIAPERAVRRASSTTTPTPTSPPAPLAASPAATPGLAAAAPPTPTPAIAAPTTSPETRAATPEPTAPTVGATGDVAGEVDRFFRSPAFATAWEETTRLAYTGLQGADPTQPLLLDLSPILPGLADALDAPLPAGAAAALRVEVLDAPAADRLRTALDRLDWLSILLPAVALLLLIGTLWAGPGKLRWLARLGFGLALSMIVLLLILLLGVPVLSGRVEDPVAAAVVNAVLDALLWWPVLLAAALVAGGLVLAVIAGFTNWLVVGRLRRRA